MQPQHTQAVIKEKVVSLLNIRKQTNQFVKKPTITMIADHYNFILDVARDDTNRVPDGGHLCVNLIDQSHIDFALSSKVETITCADFTEEDLCVCPRDGNRRDRRDVSSLNTGGIQICWSSRRGWVT